MSGATGLRVVLAEDDFLVGTEVVRLAESVGWAVVEVVRDGGAAVEAVVRHRPDVALLDVQMGEVSGLEAARRIRDVAPVPVVILTAYETADLVREASEAGVGAYLTKPASRAELERAVLVATARFADLAELRRVNAELRRALAEVRTLTGLLPMCCFCKKVRTDRGYWQAVDAYINDHTAARISHSFCPECAEEHYPDAGGEGRGG